VIRSARQSSGVWRHVCLTLAALAIALKVLVPPGFMAAPPSNDLPFALVLCTSQGSTIIQSGEALGGHGHSDQAPDEGGHQNPCVFAGHGLGAPPPSLVDAGAVTFVAYLYRPQAAVAHLAPGHGLTGPPLPARGPPALLI